MDLTSTDILFGLGAATAAVLVASAVYWFSGRPAGASAPIPEVATGLDLDFPALDLADAAPDLGTPQPRTAPPPATPQPRTAPDPEPHPAPGPGADPHGRHRAPEELLRAATYRLSADRVARARVPAPDQRSQSSQAMPSPSRSRS